MLPLILQKYTYSLQKFWNLCLKIRFEPGTIRILSEYLSTTCFVSGEVCGFKQYIVVRYIKRLSGRAVGSIDSNHRSNELLFHERWIEKLSEYLLPTWSADLTKCLKIKITYRTEMGIEPGTNILVRDC